MTQNTPSNPNSASTPIPETIPDILAFQAERIPDADAILSPGGPCYTYARLLEAVRSAGSLLKDAAVKRSDRVAIVLPNGPEAAVAFLAAASYAVSAPLNPAYGANEIDFYLSDLKARLLIVPRGIGSPAVEVAAARGIPVMEWDPAAGAAACPPFAQADDIALVLHTSGTTSRPKMVPLTQRNLCLSARHIAQWFSLSESDCCLNIMPLFHVHGLIGAVLSSLAAGASVVCTPGLDATRWYEWMARFRPSWFTAVPTMHQAILARAALHEDIVKAGRLRFIRSCSSALAPKLMEDLEAAFGVPVLESYGMTEASHQIASNPLPPRPHKAGSVGPAAGPEVAVMDSQGNLLPSGRTGEIVLRGPTITRGYLSNPEANEKGFSKGWFRTGDQGHIDGDGYIFISGRIKEIINRGGEKISPREIDEVLLQHPDVSQAVAFPIPHVQLGEDVGAAVVLKPGAKARVSDLRRFAASRLAFFKVPRVIRILEEIPKGATGKVQRTGLAQRLGLQPIDDTAVPKAAFRAPENPLQEKLVRLWSDVLAVKDIGVDDSFFALGGDSILATALMIRLAREMGTHLSLADFMDNPTIAGMAEAIQADIQGKPAAGTHLLVEIQPRGNFPPLFCFPGRDGNLLGFWNLSRRLGPEQPVYAFAADRTGRSNRPLTIEEIAAACVRLMRSIEPRGPYRLLGNCFGGLVVYEMARQLSQEGEETVLLAMLDCFNIAWRRRLPAARLCTLRANHAAVRFRFHWKNLSRLGMDQRFDYLKRRAALFVREARLRVLQRVHDACVRMRKPLPEIVSQIDFAHRWAEQKYKRRSYSGTVSLFRTTDPAAGIYPAPLMGWEGLLQGRVDLYDVPGEHLAMLSEPAVDAIAAVLRGTGYTVPLKKGTV